MKIFGLRGSILGEIQQALMNNILQLHGFAFIEFTTNEPTVLSALFSKLGFIKINAPVSRTTSAYRQGDAIFLINSEPNPFLSKHGASIRGIGLIVEEERAAIQACLAQGAVQALTDVESKGVLEAPMLQGIGGSLLYLVGKSRMSEFDPAPSPNGIVAIDHASNIVHPQNLDRWAEFYQTIFGFTQKQYLDVKGKVSGMRARSMVSPSGKVSIPIAASAYDQPGVLNQNDEFIRDYGGEGVQHLALLTTDVETTVRSCEMKEIEFMPAPSDQYYRGIDARLPGHTLDVSTLRKAGLLVDGKDGVKILLQRFTRRQVGPIFFEMIERRGEDGFGEGNFKALFESQEQDQVTRGIVTTDASKAV